MLSDFVSLCKEDTVPQHLTPKAFGACGFTAVPVRPDNHRDRSGVQKQSESADSLCFFFILALILILYFKRTEAQTRSLPHNSLIPNFATGAFLLMRCFDALNF
jgi:hypothetical protein